MGSVGVSTVVGRAMTGHRKGSPMVVHSRDSWLRCIIVGVTVRVAFSMQFAALRLLSGDHPGRIAHESGMRVWEEKVGVLPWRGFVPRHRVSAVDLAWLFAILVVTLFVSDYFGLELDGWIAGNPHLLPFV